MVKKNLKNDFLTWWLNNTTRFDNYIRIIVGWHGFSKSVINIVKEHNQKYGKTQPIILVETSEELIGKDLKNNQNLKILETEKDENNIKWNCDLSILYDVTKLNRSLIGFCKCKNGNCDSCPCKTADVLCEDKCDCKKKCKQNSNERGIIEPPKKKK